MSQSASVHREIKKQLIDAMQADATFMALTKGNIYGRSYAEILTDTTLENYQFPMVTFRLVGSARTTPITHPYRVSLLVQCWSKDDYDEAWEVAEQLTSLLDHERFIKNSVISKIRVINAGQEAFDPTSQLYYVIQQFTIYSMTNA